MPCSSFLRRFGDSANRLLHLVVLQTAFDRQLTVLHTSRAKFPIDDLPMVVLTSESIVIIECTLTHNHFAASGHLPFTKHSIDQNKDVGDGRHPHDR